MGGIDTFLNVRTMVEISDNAKKYLDEYNCDSKQTNSIQLRRILTKKIGSELLVLSSKLIITHLSHKKDVYDKMNLYFNKTVDLLPISSLTKTLIFSESGKDILKKTLPKLTSTILPQHMERELLEAITKFQASTDVNNDELIESLNVAVFSKLLPMVVAATMVMYKK